MSDRALPVDRDRETWPRRVRAGIKSMVSRRWLRRAFQVAALLCCGIYLAASLRHLPLAALTQIRLAPLLAGIGLTIVAVFFGAGVWWLTLLGMGQPTALLSAAKMHLAANLAKYIPGYAWQLMSKAVLARDAGVPTETVGVAMAVELVQTAATGAGLALCLFPAVWSFGPLAKGQLAAVGHAAGVLVLATLSALPWALRRILLKAGQRRAASAIRAGALWAAAATMAAGWLVFGIGYWFLGVALAPLGIADLQIFCFALITSVLAGLAVIFVPGGVGVHESLMVLLLGTRLPAGPAVILALLTRLAVTLAEVAAALITRRLPSSGRS